MKPTLIGISGTNGSGKDMTGEILAHKFGYMFISVTDFLREEAKSRGLLTERKNTGAISAEWRREHGFAVLVNKALTLFEPQAALYKGLAMASLRHPAEADRIHELGGVILWLDADPHLRYDRIQAHIAQRNLGVADEKTFEQFVAEEQFEMHPSGDAATLDMASVKAKADVNIINDFPTETELTHELEKQLRLGQPLA